MGKLSEKITDVNSLRRGPRWDDIDFPRLFDEWYSAALELEASLAALVRYHKARIAYHSGDIGHDEYSKIYHALSPEVKRMLEE